jgi:hypothetical protein
MEKLLVVICGNLRHGKDTVADALARELGPLLAARDSFARPLKDCVAIKLGVPREWLDDGDKKDDPAFAVYGKTLRLHMQEEGEDARRRIAETIWADRLDDRHRARREPISIVSDGRHPDQEVVGARRRGPTYAVKVFRPSVPIAWGHPSEDKVARAPDSLFDEVLLNDGTLEELLENKVPRLAARVLAALERIGQ